MHLYVSARPAGSGTASGKLDAQHARARLQWPGACAHACQTESTWFTLWMSQTFLKSLSFHDCQILVIAQNNDQLTANQKIPLTPRTRNQNNHHLGMKEHVLQPLVPVCRAIRAESSWDAIWRKWEAIRPNFLLNESRTSTNTYNAANELTSAVAHLSRTELETSQLLKEVTINCIKLHF